MIRHCVLSRFHQDTPAEEIALADLTTDLVTAGGNGASMMLV